MTDCCRPFLCSGLIAPDRNLTANARLPVIQNLMEFNLDAETPLVETTHLLDPRIQMIFTADDPTASEDGAGTDTCSDGFDNGPDGDADELDSDCRIRLRRQIDAPIDWSGDGVFHNDGDPDVNINDGANDDENLDLFLDIDDCTGNTALDTLASYDEWTNVSLAPGWGVSGPISLEAIFERLPTQQEIEAWESELNLANLVLNAHVAATSVRVDEPFILEIDVKNTGPNPAARSLVRINLPDGITHVSSWANCTLPGTSEIECDLGFIRVDGQVSFRVKLVASPNTAGDKRRIEIQALHLEGDDKYPPDNIETIDIVPQPDRQTDAALFLLLR